MKFEEWWNTKDYPDCCLLRCKRAFNEGRKDLEKALEQEKNLNAEIKARFVKCNTCTEEMKSKCLMFSENLCEGERCEELVDLMALVNKNDLQSENEQQKELLSKAIGIIKRWYETNRSACIEPSQELVEVTEQFLKKIEKEWQNL